MKEFLESVPPGQSKAVSDLVQRQRLFGTQWGGELAIPDIRLFCPTEPECGKEQMYAGVTVDATLYVGAAKNLYVTYTCRNCKAHMKIFALRAMLGEKQTEGVVFKFGELPQFGPPNPPKLITLLQGDKELYLKGRRAENQAMGIAAFAYYRRVIESQKSRIFDAILRVCRAYAAPADMIADIEAAKMETQFTKAIEAIKHGLPDVLFINGENPLTLIHDALSQGLHADSDEECLEIATDIRTILANFAERMAEAVRDDADLMESVARLIRRRAERGKKAATPAPTANTNKAVL